MKFNECKIEIYPRNMEKPNIWSGNIANCKLIMKIFISLGCKHQHGPCWPAGRPLSWWLQPRNGRRTTSRFEMLHVTSVHRYWSSGEQLENSLRIQRWKNGGTAAGCKGKSWWNCTKALRTWVLLWTGGTSLWRSSQRGLEALSLLLHSRWFKCSSPVIYPEILGISLRTSHL